MVDLSVDADFANGVDTVKSTSAFDTAINGPATWISYDWGSKSQTATARSTAESELIALDLGTFRSGIPCQVLLEAVLLREVTLLAREDNAAAFQVVKRGHSKKLAHIAKTHRVSVSALSEVYWGHAEEGELGDAIEHETNQMLQQPTETQRADLMTKALSPARHWELVAMHGMSFRAAHVELEEVD